MVFTIHPDDLWRFLFLTVRIGAMLLSLPLVNSRHIPAPLKILFIFTVSLGLYPLVQDVPLVVPVRLGHLVLLVLGELFVGMTVGFVAQGLFAGIQLGGEVISQQMGLHAASLADPHEGYEISALTNFQYVLAVFVFFSSLAHHWFIYALAESVRSIPLLGCTIPATLMEAVIGLLGKMFITALQLTAPVMAAILLATLVLGILARLVPQLNMFALSYPITLGTGMLVLGWTLPWVFHGFHALFGQLGPDLMQVIHLLGAR